MLDFIASSARGQSHDLSDRVITLRPESYWFERLSRRRYLTALLVDALHDDSADEDGFDRYDGFRG